MRKILMAAALLGFAALNLIVCPLFSSEMPFWLFLPLVGIDLGLAADIIVRQNESLYMRAVKYVLPDSDL